jgi:hypothetical protein
MSFINKINSRILFTYWLRDCDGRIASEVPVSDRKAIVYLGYGALATFAFLYVLAIYIVATIL